MWLQAKKSACSTMTNPASSDSKMTPEGPTDLALVIERAVSHCLGGGPRIHLCDLRKENGPSEGAAKVVTKS
jgi:hypothetical protein